MTLLLTGYEPFGDHERNPSAEVAQELDGQHVAGRKIVGRVLPVEFDRASEEMEELIAEFDPEAIVATGLAAGRAAVNVERVGINVADCGGIPDNADAEPRNERICEGEDVATAYFSSLPVVEVVERLLDHGIPARVSNTAGTHLCNDVLYETRAYLEREDAKIPMGFVHLPRTPTGVAEQSLEGEALSGGSVEASMPLAMQVDAVEIAFEAVTE